MTCNYTFKSLVKAMECSNIPTNSAMVLRLLLKVCLNPGETQVHRNPEHLCGMPYEQLDIHGLWLCSRTDNTRLRIMAGVCLFSVQEEWGCALLLEPCPLGLCSWSVYVVQTIPVVTGFITVAPVGLFSPAFSESPGFSVLVAFPMNCGVSLFQGGGGSLDSVIRLW